MEIILQASFCEDGGGIFLCEGFFLGTVHKKIKAFPVHATRHVGGIVI
jgi:hypothetical protein